MAFAALVATTRPGIPGAPLRDYVGVAHLNLAQADERKAEGKRYLSPASSDSTSTDFALVSAIRSRNEAAVAQLYDRYSAIVYSVALRVLGDTAAAEDILQEVFLQLWRNPDVFDSKRGCLAAWLAVITRNRAIDMLRKRRPETEITDLVISTESDLFQGVELERTIEKVRVAMGHMPASQRSALEMSFFQGLTHGEIAERTGEPLGTIKTRIRSGLLLLRKMCYR